MATNQQKLDRVHSHISDDKQKEWMEKLARTVLQAEFKRRDGQSITLAGQMSWWATDIAVLRAENAAILEALKQSAGGAPIDYEKVGQASAKAITEYVESVEKTTTTVNLKDGK